MLTTKLEISFIVKQPWVDLSVCLNDLQTMLELFKQMDRIPRFIQVKLCIIGCSFCLNSAHSQSIIINEVSQGPSGAQEYVEFLVTGPDLLNCNDIPPCIDLRLWVFDDNNGNLNTGGAQTGVGIAGGACRFADDPFWSCIPAGTIIVIYNDADPNGGLPANDLSMGDGNCTLVVPISSGLFDHHPSEPNSTNATYPSTGWINGGSWTNISMANGGDGFQIYDPANMSSPVHSVGWDENDLAQIYYTNSSMSGSVISATDCNYFSQGSWFVGSASTDQTPGAPNNATQADCIGNMNANCNPPVITLTATPETCAGACDGTASAAINGGTPPYLLTWSPAPGAGQGTANISGLCPDTYTLTLVDDNGTGCTLVDSVAVPAGPSCCLITNFTTSIGACDPVTGDYSTTGTVEFFSPPATGQLIIEDCNGVQQVFNAPFTSPTNYTLTGQTPDGAACSITAYFTSDISCTQSIPYTAPTCPCNMDVFNANIGLCDQATDTYCMTGDVEFTFPPGTGTLNVEVFNGTTTYDTIINPPFNSPQTYSIC
ncbi:MAG: SprB repeat-containing protein, partial [Crocinitomicaceae bacterium]|nr:SprB repeat-containing protein [Crocinitomicaceae bacterium]